MSFLARIIASARITLLPAVFSSPETALIDYDSQSTVQSIDGIRTPEGTDGIKCVKRDKLREILQLQSAIARFK